MNKKTALITGITGQDGAYLSELLLEKGYTVHGIKRRSSSHNTSRINHLIGEPQDKKNKFFLHYGDMTDSLSLIGIINKIRPDEIYNLAALSHVKVSFENPEFTTNTNALGTLRILEAIKLLKLEKKTKFYQASTSEMFGNSSSFQSEITKFEPESPYAASKLYAYWITKIYRKSYNIFASNGILFNHESPLRGETFVTKKIISRLYEISKGSDKKLYLGNLNSIRDWGHAKDYVYGQWKILQASKPDDYILATGVSKSVRDFVNIAAKKMGFKLVWKGRGINEKGLDLNTNRIIIELDKRYYRPVDVNNLRGNSKKARKNLNWKPKYNINKLIDDMIYYEENNEKKF